jgi:site-specific DNA recombinase
MKKMIAYVRSSTCEQNITLKAQQDKISLWAQLHEVELVDIVVEQASARTLNRPGLVSCLERLGTDCDGLVVLKLDRLTRSTLGMGQLIQNYFEKYSLVSVVENIDTSTPSGRLVLNVLTSVAQWEVEQTSQRTSTALQQLKKEGAKLGRSPFGYTKRGNAREVNEDEMKVVREIKTLRADGNTLQTICDQLNAAGVPTRLGTAWGKATVGRIVKREYPELAA